MTPQGQEVEPVPEEESSDDEMPLDSNGEIQIFEEQEASQVEDSEPALNEAFTKKNKNNQVKILLEVLRREKAKTNEVKIRFDVLLTQFKQKVSLNQ